MTCRFPLLMLLLVGATDAVPAQPPKATDAASAAVNAALARQPKRKKAPALSAGKPAITRDGQPVVPAGRIAPPQRSAGGTKAPKR
jgi:hypothetical protein